MTAREDLRETGTKTRQRLGLPVRKHQSSMPGLPNLVSEVVFGRVWSRPGLALDERMLATLSALTSKQYLPQLGTYLHAALSMDMSPRMLQEVMLHCAMYAGIPTAQNSLAVLDSVLEENGITVDAETLPEVDLDEMEAMGRETMRALHAERADAGYAAPDSAASELYATAIQYLYGEIWNRPGISRRQRMICSVAAFTANQMETQQKKFFRSAQNVGLTRTEIMEIITQTGPYSGFPTALNALTVAEQVLD